MRSGRCAATASKSISLPPTLGGRAPPSSSCGHGRYSSGNGPMKSRTPTGTPPSASAKSASLKPTVTTRCGGAGIRAVPNMCSIVTGHPRWRRAGRSALCPGHIRRSPAAARRRRGPGGGWWHRSGVGASGGRGRTAGPQLLGTRPTIATHTSWPPRTCPDVCVVATRCAWCAGAASGVRAGRRAAAARGRRAPGAGPGGRCR